MASVRRSGGLRAVALALIVAFALAACSGSGSDAESDTGAVAPDSSESVGEEGASATTATAPATTEPTSTTSTDESTVAGDPTADRPYDVFVPSGYDPSTPMPLLLLLHGYTASGDTQEAYFNFEPLAESRGFLYVHPDGTVDPNGQRFWNATDACCAFGGEPPDDAAYLLAIIEQVSDDYSVDPNAIFLAGHSNGGFMSYRMACEHADTIAGIASLAGATFADSADCTPSEPVSVLQVHGTDDTVIAYDGGAIFGNDYPSARQTVESWVASNSCDPTPSVTADTLDLDAAVDGSESDTEVFTGCELGAQVELWTIDDGSHVPDVTDEFSAAVVDFLLDHPKP